MNILCSKSYSPLLVVIPLFLTLAVIPSAATEYAIAIGPSFANTSQSGKPSSSVSGLDLTYAINTDFPKIWFSGGLRNISGNGEKISVPYLEMGIWCFVNIGIGYSRMDDGADRSGNAIHLFLGAPVGWPISSGENGHAIIIEPYYRPTFPLYGDHNMMNEYGILLCLYYERNSFSLAEEARGAQCRYVLTAISSS
jgi:hypothetical protein